MASDRWRQVEDLCHAALAYPAEERRSFVANACQGEMLTGRNPFGGETVSDMIVAILEREPNWQILPKWTPPDVRRLLQRTLEKDPHRRLHDVADVRIELEDARSASSGGAASSEAMAAPSSPLARMPLWRRLALPTAATVLASLAVGSAVWLAGRPDAPPVTRFEVAHGGAAALSLTNSGGDFAVTPNGSLIYRGTGTTGAQVLLRARDQIEPRPIAVQDARDFFVSPDGQSIGFVGVASPMTLSRAALGGKGDPHLQPRPLEPGRDVGRRRHHHLRK